MTGHAIERTAMLVMRPWIGSCAWAMDRMSGHLDHELGKAEERRIGRHLARCARCRAVFESLTRAVARVRTMGREELDGPGPSVVEPVLERIRHERE